MAYAAWVFDGVVPYSEVLASRYWHDGTGWGCTFAVVRLAPDATSVPPVGTGHAARADFGGDWRTGPLPPLPEMTRDALSTCREGLGAEGAEALTAALADPALRWMRDDPVGETVQLYAINAGVAARIRLGD